LADGWLFNILLVITFHLCPLFLIMLLVVTATDLEMAPISHRLANTPGWIPLVTGIGCLESAVALTRFLAETTHPLTGIVNAGVAGAFIGAGPGVLDLCLADQETQADVGIWTPSGIMAFDTIQVPTHFPLVGPLLERAKNTLQRLGVKFWTGPFVSVLAASGTLARGEALRQQYHALCENMEGAAVARVAQAYQLPCLELRAISNMVEDRDLSRWQIASAMERLAEVLPHLLPNLAPADHE